jgi:hypothetical protein
MVSCRCAADGAAAKREKHNVKTDKGMYNRLVISLIKLFIITLFLIVQYNKP